jgi:hypothetical protein
LLGGEEKPDTGFLGEGEVPAGKQSKTPALIFDPDHFQEAERSIPSVWADE